MACTAKVVTYKAAGKEAAAGQAEAVVQSTLRLDTVRRPGLGQDEGARHLEEDATAALAAAEGAQEVVGSSVVAVVPSTGGH